MSCSEPHFENEASHIVFILKISFHSHGNETNFHKRIAKPFGNGLLTEVL